MAAYPPEPRSRSQFFGKVARLTQWSQRTGATTLPPQIQSLPAAGDTLFERSGDAAIMVVIFAAKAAIALGVISFNF